MIGLVGSGNMARALALGWGEPVLCTDAFPEKAAQLASETGGEACSGNGDLADRADIVILCHKPAQLNEVAEQIGGRAKGVISILGATPLASVKQAYGDTPAVRMLPSTPVEVKEGVTVMARDPDGDRQLQAKARDLFGRVGKVVTIEDGQIDTAMGLMSSAPAYMALVAEAQIDAGVKHGIPADAAAEMVTQTMAGTARLIEHRGYDTLGVRRAVTSPGGSTAKGLAQLEKHGVRTAFTAAMEALQ